MEGGREGGREGVREGALTWFASALMLLTLPATTTAIAD
jgi:hypothetical protein